MAVLLLGGCLGAGVRGGARPGVMPMLSELPADATKRDAVLDSANTAAGPEQRKRSTSKERKAETAAATAAAILGGLFSKTQSVTIGAASQFDENQLIAPHAVPVVQPSSATPDDATTSDGSAKANGSARGNDAAQPKAPPTNDPDASNADLIPWIKLR